MEASKYTVVLATLALGFAGVLAAPACSSSDGGGGSGASGGAGGGTTTSSDSTSSSSSSSSSSSTGHGGTGAGGDEPGTGICATEYTIDGDVFDGCLTAFCCAAFNPCVADEDCTACLADPEAAGCDANQFFTAYITCFDESCPGTICDTDLGIQTSPNMNACVDDNCCATFNPCEQDTACAACLAEPDGAGCDALQLYTDYTTCSDAYCPADICGTNIIFGITYENGSQDTDIAANLCAQTSCCADLQNCADPNDDGDPTEEEVEACLLCLQGDPGCAAGAVKDAADAFSACFETNCAP